MVLMGNYEDYDLGNGGFERVHLGSDGRPNGRREFINNNNWKTQAEMEQFYDAVYPHRYERCSCGFRFQPHEYTTRASNNFFGIGRKGTVKNAVKCENCGRVEHR